MQIENLEKVIGGISKKEIAGIVLSSAVFIGLTALTISNPGAARDLALGIFLLNR